MTPKDKCKYFDQKSSCTFSPRLDKNSRKKIHLYYVIIRVCLVFGPKVKNSEILLKLKLKDFIPDLKWVS